MLSTDRPWDRDPADHSTEQFASVVVVTRDRASSLARALTAIGRLDHPHFEVVVVDHSSRDDTAAVIARCGAKHVVAPPAAGIGGCRQLGIDASDGAIVAMCDDDCVPAPDWLSVLCQRLVADPGLGLVGGRVVNIGFPEEKRYKGRTRMVGPNGVLAFAADPAEAEFFGNANLAFRRTAAEAVGGYDPLCFAGEEIDLELAMRRVGFSVAYEPAAVVDHHFTGISHKRGRLLRSGELIRLYRCMKHFPPSGTRAWLRFWRHELGLLARDLRRVLRAAGSALLRFQPRRLPAVAIDLANVLSARAAVPWLLHRGRRRWRETLDHSKPPGARPGAETGAGA